MTITSKVRLTVAACVVFSATAVFPQKPKPKATPAQTPPKVVTPKATPTPAAETNWLAAALDEMSEADELIKRGQAAWKQLQITAAIENYTKALTLTSGRVDALRERGTIFYLIGRHAEAERDLTAFIKSQAAPPAEVVFYRAMAYSAIGKELAESGSRKEAGAIADKAYADFNAAIKQEPANAQYLNGRGRLCLDFNLHDEAIEDFEKAVKLDAKFAAAYANLGLAKLLKFGVGLAEINKAIELNPTFAEAYYNRANYHRAQGDLDKAISDYTKAIAEHDTNARYYNGRGLVYFQTGAGRQAAKDFTTAIAQKPDFALAYLNRALTYKKFPAAAADNPDAGFAEILVAQRAKLEADLDAAIKYGPNIADSYVERGLMRSTSAGSTLDSKTTALLNSALADFDRAITLDPRAARAFGARASIRKTFGKRDDALADYNRAIEIDPRLATAYMGRMSIYCEMGKSDLSIADEKKVRELGFAAINMCNLGR